MEVNWIVKATQCLGLSFQSTKLSSLSTHVSRHSKMDDLFYYSYLDNTLKTLSTKHLELFFSCGTGVKESFSSDRKKKIIISLHINAILWLLLIQCFVGHCIYLIANAKWEGQRQVLLSCSSWPVCCGVSDKVPQETDTGMIKKKALTSFLGV